MAKAKKYRCLNFGNCDKAGKKEQFEIPEGGELKCPECGSEMIQEVKASNTMMIAIIVAAVVAIAVAAFALTRGSDNEEAPAQEPVVEEVVEEAPATDQAVDSTATAEAARQQAIADSIAAAEAEALAKAREDSVKAAEEAAKAKGNTPAAPSNYLTNARCQYGLYTGPAVNGKPGGGLGTVKVQGSHSIDLRHARKETIDVNSGDIILNAKFSDGRLVSGLVKFANGQARQFNAGV